MPISFTCESCGHSMKAPEKFAGKRVRCKQCNEFTPIPELEDEDVPSFNPYTLDDDEPVLPKRSARRGDDLLGESPPPQEVLPKRIGMGDYGETPRSKRDRDGEAPVCGLPPIQVIGICAGILALTDIIFLSQAKQSGQSLTLIGGQVIGTLIATGIMSVAGKVVDIEPSSMLRLMSISLAQSAVQSVGQLIILMAGQDNPGVVIIAGLVVLVSCIMILARSLGLGCLGLIGFVLVEMVILFVAALALGFVVGLITAGLQPK